MRQFCSGTLLAFSLVKFNSAEVSNIYECKAEDATFLKLKVVRGIMNSSKPRSH